MILNTNCGTPQHTFITKFNTLKLHTICIYNIYVLWKVFLLEWSFLHNPYHFWFLYDSFISNRCVVFFQIYDGLISKHHSFNDRDSFVIPTLFSLKIVCIKERMYSIFKIGLKNSVTQLLLSPYLFDYRLNYTNKKFINNKSLNILILTTVKLSLIPSIKLPNRVPKNFLPK